MAKLRAVFGVAAALMLMTAFAPHGDAATSMASTLRVTVTGITPAGGTLRVELHDEATFSEPAAKPLRRQDIPKIAGDVSVVFAQLPPGAYALKAYQDINGNGKADAGEPSGISNNAAASNSTPLRWPSIPATIRPSSACAESLFDKSARAALRAKILVERI